jgi:hypothetical protein
MATEALGILQQQRTPGTVKLIMMLARANGYWSVWMTIFKDEAEIRQRLVENYTGTHRGSFAADFRPQRRAGGSL